MGKKSPKKDVIYFDMMHAKNHCYAFINIAALIPM